MIYNFDDRIFIKGGNTMNMNKYNILGIILIVLAAISYMGHYFLAAICMIPSGAWNSELYQLILKSVGQPLVILAFANMIVGVVLFGIKPKSSQ